MSNNYRIMNVKLLPWVVWWVNKTIRVYRVWLWVASLQPRESLQDFWSYSLLLISSVQMICATWPLFRWLLLSTELCYWILDYDDSIGIAMCNDSQLYELLHWCVMADEWTQFCVCFVCDCELLLRCSQGTARRTWRDSLCDLSLLSCLLVLFRRWLALLDYYICFCQQNCVNVYQIMMKKSCMLLRVYSLPLVWWVNKIVCCFWLWYFTSFSCLLALFGWW